MVKEDDRRGEAPNTGKGWIPCPMCWVVAGVGHQGSVLEQTDAEECSAPELSRRLCDHRGQLLWVLPAHVRQMRSHM